ncbi:MAG: hypothetical protein ACXAC7_12785 [Candidatus Hodarchaeales archaeon]
MKKTNIMLIIVLIMLTSPTLRVEAIGPSINNYDFTDWGTPTAGVPNSWTWNDMSSGQTITQENSLIYGTTGSSVNVSIAASNGIATLSQTPCCWPTNYQYSVTLKVYDNIGSSNVFVEFNTVSTGAASIDGSNNTATSDSPSWRTIFITFTTDSTPTDVEITIVFHGDGSTTGDLFIDYAMLSPGAISEFSSNITVIVMLTTITVLGIVIIRKKQIS